MKLNKELMTKIALGTAAAVFVFGVSVISLHNKDKDKNQIQVARTASEGGILAGVSNVFNTDNVVIPSFTSGVSTVLNDFPTTSISSDSVDVVAFSANESEDEASDTTGVGEDGTFCGYTNIGIANVETSNLNVRSEPTTDSKIVGKMTRHNACEIIEVVGDWTKIISGNVSGYVKSEYLITGEEALAIAKEEVCTYATVTTETLRVRSETSTESSIVVLVNKGEDLVVVEELDEWVLVEVDDETGYVFKEYVTIAPKLPTAKTITEIRYGEGVSDVRVDLVQYALQFVGNRYVWGGESLKKGVDCSGFTMKIYEKYGVYLPHSSRSQPSYGTKIKASNAQPGDLFFYGNGKRINHVAIYIGNGKIVHASNKRDGIKISNAYYRTPVCVVSYLDD